MGWSFQLWSQVLSWFHFYCTQVVQYVEEFLGNGGLPWLQYDGGIAVQNPASPFHSARHFSEQLQTQKLTVKLRFPSSSIFTKTKSNKDRNKNRNSFKASENTNCSKMQDVVILPSVRTKPIIIAIKTPKPPPHTPPYTPCLIRSPVKSLSNLCIAADTLWYTMEKRNYSMRNAEIWKFWGFR